MGLWASQKAAERRNSQQPRPEPADLQELKRGRRGRCLSKRLRDKERSIERQKVFQERREEIRKLFGHAKLKNGEILSINEATEKLRTNVIGPEDIEQWFLPEGVRDVLNSIGEVDANTEYPALGITKGTVLFDPKIRVPGGHQDPAIRQEFHISGAELRTRTAAGKHRLGDEVEE